jgi:hypothetical protein
MSFDVFETSAFASIAIPRGQVAYIHDLGKDALEETASGITRLALIFGIAIQVNPSNNK